MTDTEAVQIPIAVPAIDIEQMITQAVVNSKLNDLVATAIAKVLSDTYTVQREIENVIKGEVRNIISQTLSMPYVDDEKNPGHGDENHPARRLRAAIVAAVDEKLAEPDSLKKLVDGALGRGY